MRTRNGKYGDRNLCGAVVERLRKQRGLKQSAIVSELQKRGVNLSISAYSRLEGQQRAVTYGEIAALAQIFDVPADRLLNRGSEHNTYQ